MSNSGIDLGTGTVSQAILDAQGNPVMLAGRSGQLCFPAVVFLDESGLVVGAEACAAGFQDPARCVRDWKRQMGTDEVLAVGPER